MLAALLLGSLLGSLVTRRVLRTEEQPVSTRRFEILLDETVDRNASSNVEISRDARTLVYRGESGVLVRRLDSLEDRPIEGSQSYTYPFLSPG